MMKQKKDVHIQKKHIAGILVAIILLSEITMSQFPWQLNNPIFSFPEHSSAFIDRLWELASKYKSNYPEMFYLLSRRVEFIHYFSHKIDKLMNLYVTTLIPFLMLNPPIENPMILSAIRFSVSLLQPLYIFAILLTATYLLFISGSPRGRAKGKATFVKLIIGLGIIMLTSPLIQLFLEISHGFTSLILDVFKPNPEIFKLSTSFFMSYFTMITFFKPAVGSFFLLASLFLPLGVFVVLSTRYLLVIFLTILFPFLVLFYSFSPTQRLGKKLLFSLFSWIFLPLFEATILGITSIGVLAFPIQEIKIFISTTGFFLLISSPIIMIYIMNFILGIGTISRISEEIGRRVTGFIVGEE
jgi:hypothetical protein